MIWILATPFQIQPIEQSLNAFTADTNGQMRAIVILSWLTQCGGGRYYFGQPRSNFIHFNRLHFGRINVEMA